MLFIGVSQKRRGDIYHDVRVHQKLHLKSVFKKYIKVDEKRMYVVLLLNKKLQVKTLNVTSKKPSTCNLFSEDAMKGFFDVPIFYFLFIVKS